MRKQSLFLGFFLVIFSLLACNQDNPSQIKQGHSAQEQIEFRISLENKSGENATRPIFAATFWLSDAKQTLFEPNQPASAGLQQLLTNASANLLNQSLQVLQPTPPHGLIATESTNPRQFSFKASPGSKLSLIQTLQKQPTLFLAPGKGTLDLFDANNEPISGDFSLQFSLWEMDTPENQSFIRAKSAPENIPDPSQCLSVRIENNDGHTHAEDDHSH